MLITPGKHLRRGMCAGGADIAAPQHNSGGAKLEFGFSIIVERANRCTKNFGISKLSDIGCSAII